MVFEPVLEADMEQFQEDNRHEDIPAFTNINDSTAWYLQGLKDSGLCLLENFKLHPNALTQLRLFNFFCIFQLIRYLTMLEAFYCGETIRPILLNFSGLTPSQSSVARASEISYTQMHKSINRFYAWGYAKWLEENGYDKATLANSETPTYESAKKLTSTSQEELTALWDLAKEQANTENEDVARISYGETMYDIHHYHPDASPEEMVRYLKELTADIEYHLKNEKLCRFLLSAAGDIWSYEKMKESLISTGRKNFENGKMTHWDNLDYRINFFAAGFIDTIHTWLQKKDRTSEQMAKFLLEMLVLLRS